MNMEDQNITKKINTNKLIQALQNEIDAARDAYQSAYNAWVAMPTIINQQARDKAYDHLEHIRSLYNAGRRALIQKRVIEVQRQ
jgi:hypothetical protein